MSDHTPSLDVLAAHYCNDRSADNYEERMAYEAKRRVEFDRAIAKVRAEAKAEALREAADAYDYNAWSSTYTSMQDDPDANLDAVGVSIEWLKARADKLVTE